MKVFEVKYNFNADQIKETELVTLIAAESKEKAEVSLLKNYQKTSEFSAEFYWTDYEFENEKVEIVSIEEFNNPIINNPDIFSEIPMIGGKYFSNRVGSWDETIEGLTYNEDGFAKFRRVFIDIPNDEAGKKLIIHYDSDYDNPNNDIIRDLTMRGVNPWGV